jgi:hypothetical protein
MTDRPAPPMSPTPLRPDQRPQPALDAKARVRGSERLAAILNQRDPARVVADTPLMDLFHLIKEVGLESAQEVLELCSPDQVQAFLDLDGWEGDRLLPSAVTPWLAALVEAGPDFLTGTLRDLDPELTALLIQRWTRIYNLYEEEVPDDEEPPFFATPDRFYMVKITADDAETVRVVERTIDWLYRGDQTVARHILRAAASEPGPELEETCFRWRSARMAELGYAPLDEALEVYQPLELGKIGGGEPPVSEPGSERLPVVLLGQVTGQTFLGRVLSRITDPEVARRLEHQLVLVFNKVLAADRVAPGDTVRAAEFGARAAATLSLGLEALARGDEAAAAKRLVTVSLTRLHRVGHTIGLQLGRLVATLGQRAARAEEPLLGAATALRGPRPAFARSLDAPPQPGTRPLASMDDVRIATAAITQLAAQVVLVHEVIGVDPAARGEGLTLGDVGRTACARVLLGGGAAATPLSLADVVALAQALPGGQIGPNERATVARAFGARAAERKIVLPSECGTVLDGWVAELARGVAKRGSTVVLDRQFVEGLLLE